MAVLSPHTRYPWRDDLQAYWRNDTPHHRLYGQSNGHLRQNGEFFSFKIQQADIVHPDIDSADPTGPNQPRVCNFDC